MASFTLAEAQKLGLNDLQAGIAQIIVTVAPGLGLMPFNQVAGNAYAFNRELTLVDGQLIDADGTITDSSALTNTAVTVNLKGVSGQSDIPRMELAMQIGSNAGNDIRAIHLASAAKGVARKYQDMLINGTVGANGWDGLDAMLTAFTAQDVDAADAAFSLDLVDSMLSVLTTRPQWLMGNAKAEAAFRKTMRAAGGITTVELNGVYFTSYDGIPFIRNDWIATDIDAGTVGNQTNIYAGSWDDGSATGGLAGIAPMGNMFEVTEIPALEGKDATRLRVVMYGAATVFSPLTVARLKSVTV
jgi:hypothetical protein